MYRWAAASERLGVPCFTSAWHKVTGGAIEPRGGWAELVASLRQCLKA
jgi:hypothetical protein